MELHVWIAGILPADHCGNDGAFYLPALRNTAHHQYPADLTDERIGDRSSPGDDLSLNWRGTGPDAFEGRSPGRPVSWKAVLPEGHIPGRPLAPSVPQKQKSGQFFVPEAGK